MDLNLRETGPADPVCLRLPAFYRKRGYQIMQYNFDQVIDRRNTASCRWDSDPTGKRICLGIADMDFAVATPIVDALRKRLEHPVFAYTLDEDRRYDAVIHWQKTRHGFTPEKENICWIPSVMIGVSWAIRALTKPGDSIIIQPPVYTPFPETIKKNDRVVVENRLLYSDETGWDVDYNGLEDALKTTGAKMLLLCSPHNPVGMFFTKEQLTKMVDLCYKYGAYVVADETHSDFYFHGNKHTPIFLAGPHADACCVQMASTSKSFNLAGTSQAYAIFRNKEMLDAFEKVELQNGTPANIFAFEAMIAAYTQCADWMDQLCTYLGESAQMACKFINEEIPGWSIREPQACFFLWPESDKPIPEIMPYISDEALVALRDGAQYNPMPGHNNMRLCFGTPKSVLMEALQRIADAMKKHRS